jgi:hypothetical protein
LVGPSFFGLQKSLYGNSQKQRRQVLTISANVVHAGIMAAQSIYDEHERGHLIGDVPALLLVAAVLWFLSPAKLKGPVAAS